MDLIKKAFVEAYIEERSPASSFLGNMFPINSERNVLGSESFEFDVRRSTVKVSTPTADRQVHMNKISKFSTKEMTPPTYGEGFALNVSKLKYREIGQNAYQTPAGRAEVGARYAGQIASQMRENFGDLDAKMVRAAELQACQILQECKLDLYSTEGNFALDFQRNSDLYGNAAVSWASASSDKLQDLENLARKINRLAKVKPDIVIMGAEAWKEFQADTAVQALLDNRRMEFGGISPEMRDQAVYCGNIWAGAYELQIWLYDDHYEDPETEADKSYIEPKNVVVMASKAARERQSRFLPYMTPPDPRVSQYVPARVTSLENNIDFFTNIYPTQDNKSIVGEIESSMLLYPKAVDAHGRITAIYT